MSDLARRLLTLEVFCYEQSVKAWDAKAIGDAVWWADLGDWVRKLRQW